MEHAACTAYLKHSGLTRGNVIDNAIAREEAQISTITLDSVGLSHAATCIQANQKEIYSSCNENAYRLWPLMVLKTYEPKTGSVNTCTSK